MFWRSKIGKTYILHCKMYVFSILEWNFKVPNLKFKLQSQKKIGMKFQGSKPEIEAPESETYILHCKVYVFPILEWNFKVPSLKLKPPESKTYILHCKMYVFPILEWNFKVPNLKLKPQSQKHTFYTVKCMFFYFWNEISRFQAWNWSPRVKHQGLFSEKACLDHANCVKTSILHCKMYVFSILEWNFKIPNLKFKLQSQKHTFYTVKCMFFSILEWNFKVPSLKLKPQSQKHTFYTVKRMFFQFWNEISRFQAWNWSPRVKNIHFTL